MIKKTLVIITIASALILVGWFIFASNFISWDFRNNLWGPAYLLTHGESPYRINILFSESTAVWFPQVIGVFFPLGLLPQNQASNIWLIINLAVIIGLTIFLIRKVKEKQTPLLMVGLLLLGVLFFPPTIVNLVLGQFDFLLIASLLVFAYAIENHSIPIAALSLAFALTKPQLCIIVLPCIFISLFLKRKLKYSLVLAVLTIVFAFAMTIPLWIFYVDWLKDFILNLRNLPNWWQPTLLYQLRTLFGDLGYILWSLVATACLVGCIVLWNKLPPHRAVLWSLALTTLAGPYLWSWDFTLLLPLLIDTSARLTNSYARFILFISWIASLFFSIWSYKFDDGDNRLWWLPLLMLLGLGISLFIEHRKDTDYSLANL